MILFDPVFVFTDTETLVIFETIWYELKWMGSLF